MRVLLTGHKGFIGAVMAPMLQQAGIDVVGMDTDYYRDCTFIGSVPDVPEIDRDIRDAEPADVEGFDAVVHLAALSNDPLSDFDPELTYDINHRAIGPPGAARPPGRRAPVPLLVVVQQLRRQPATICWTRRPRSTR